MGKNNNKKGKQKQETIPEEPEIEFAAISALGDILSDPENDKKDKKSKPKKGNVDWADGGHSDSGWGVRETAGNWGSDAVTGGGGGWGKQGGEESWAAATRAQGNAGGGDWSTGTAWGSAETKGNWDSATTWGATHYDDDDDDEDDEDDYGHYGAHGGGSWGATPSMSGWQNWHAEATKNASKVTQRPSSVYHTRDDVSTAQRSQILHELLNSTQNSYLSQGQQAQKKQGESGKKNKHGQAQAHHHTQSTKQKSKKHDSAPGWGVVDHSGWGDGGGGGWEASGGGGGGWGAMEEAWSSGGTSSGWGAWESPAAQSGKVQHSPWNKPDKKRNSYPMPSKTLAHAVGGQTNPLQTGFPSGKMDEYTNIHFVDSHGAALVPVQEALFGTARLAKNRLHWLFDPNKDERVAALLAWIELMTYNLGTYGLHRFLQSRERGALFTSAEYRSKEYPTGPAFDWITFDELQGTKDRTLQESVAFYDPAVQVIVFVFLPSKSGNSMAIWRRKLNVPNNTRLMFQKEIAIAKSGLRRDSQYVIHLDEKPPRRRSHDFPKRAAAPYDFTRSFSEPKPRKKPKWWQFWRVNWD